MYDPEITLLLNAGKKTNGDSFCSLSWETPGK